MCYYCISQWNFTIIREPDYYDGFALKMGIDSVTDERTIFTIFHILKHIFQWFSTESSYLGLTFSYKQ